MKGETAATLLAAAALACGGGPRRGPAVTRAWEAMGSVLTAAAWGPDSAAVDRALAGAFDSVRLADSGAREDAAGTVGREVSRVSGASLDAADEGWREATARGLALDRAALALRAAAVDSAVLDFGGLYLFYQRPTDGKRGDGASGGRTIGIPDPGNAFRPIALLTLPPAGEASGGVRALRTAVPDLEAPRPTRKSAGEPAQSATAVAGSAAEAAAWSLAFLALGCDRALAAARRAAVGLVCVAAGGRVRWSPDLGGRVATPTSGSPGASAGPAPGPAPAPGRAGAPSGSSRRWRAPGSSP